MRFLEQRDESYGNTHREWLRVFLSLVFNRLGACYTEFELLGGNRVKPSEREETTMELLGGPFVSLPYALLEKIAQLGLRPEEFLILTQILGASQVKRTTDMSAKELASLCGMQLTDVMSYIDRLLKSGFLAIGERINEQGAHCNYYDLRPLWKQMQGKDPNQSGLRLWRRDPATLFEEEFGRPLSGLECEQIIQWLEVDNHPEWMVIEALRQAVLANKYSFKYVDRVLFDWKKNNIRTKQELDAYRQSYRDRAKAREEIASAKSQSTSNMQTVRGNSQKSDRYADFYELFPDS